MADSVVFSEQGLWHLVAEMGISQIVYGNRQPPPLAHLTVDLVLDTSFLSTLRRKPFSAGT
jgi:hypothetical protein